MKYYGKNVPAPRDVGLPHDEWRDAQLPVFLDLREQYGKSKFHFAQIATGGGKTGIAAGLGSVAQTTYVAATLGLLDQAEREYGFVPIKGRQEYACVLQKKVDTWASKYGETPTARDCHFEKMPDCPASGDCPYMVQKDRALKARRAACTYRYLAVSEMMRRRGGILVLDEVHEMVDEILDLASFKIDEWTLDKWGMPDVPFNKRYGGGKGDVIDPGTRVKLEGWLLNCASALGHYDPTTKEGIQAKRLADRLRAQSTAVATGEWFLEAGPGTIARVKVRNGHSRTVNIAGVHLRPMDAKTAADKLWRYYDMVLMMSATLGSTPEALAREIGVESYSWHDYPNPVPWRYRPVYDLGVPRLTKKNLDDNPQLTVIQAVKIAQFIRTLPEMWRGIVLTSSNFKVNELRGLLDSMLPGRVLWPPDGTGTAERVELFVKNKEPGRIAVDTVQGWGHGIDLRGDIARFCVVAGVPFDNPFDPYTRARKSLPNGNAFYWWKAYNSIPQAAGRVSRGEIEDDGEFMLNIAALADGSATSPLAVKHYPAWFKAVKWDGQIDLGREVLK